MNVLVIGNAVSIAVGPGAGIVSRSPGGHDAVHIEAAALPVESLAHGVAVVRVVGIGVERVGDAVAIAVRPGAVVVAAGEGHALVVDDKIAAVPVEAVVAVGGIVRMDIEAVGNAVAICIRPLSAIIGRAKGLVLVVNAEGSARPVEGGVAVAGVIGIGVQGVRNAIAIAVGPGTVVGEGSE